MQQQKKVILFTTPTCTYCNLAKRYFKENNIRFKEVDVAKDTKAMQDMMQRTNGNKGVPVILINNRPIIGFDKNKINRMLNIN